MGILIFKRYEYIFASSYNNTTLGIFKAQPQEGFEHFMTSNLNNGTSVFRSRFVAKNANFTNIIVQIAPGAGDGEHGFGVSGLDATVLTATNTTTQNANTWMMPYIRILANGTAGTGDTHLWLWFSPGYPLASFRCLEAAPGMPWKAGDDLFEMLNRRD